jgi:hypothetical protein
MIAGFIISGNSYKHLILRGIGPSTKLPGALADPYLELRDSNSLIEENDNWMQSANASDINSSGLAPADPAEAAIDRTLASGSYTVLMRGVNDTTGIGLVELYDLDTSGSTYLANLSTRGFVLSGDNVMIGGIIVEGNGTSTCVIRALGPSLSASNVPSTLSDPYLELHDDNGNVLAYDDNWRDKQEAQLEQTRLQPTDDREAAILYSFAPGNYTAIVRGANGETGNALLEFYNLSQ